MNEIPTYTAPEGVNGPTLGRDLPDGCERLGASLDPGGCDEWWSGSAPVQGTLYWWRPVSLKVGDRVQLTGTVERVDEGGGYTLVQLDGEGGRWLNTAALTRVVTP